MAARGRNIPSVLGGGLERGTRAILEATLEREEREQRRELAERQLGIAERTQAINQITTLAGFMEPGTTLGEAGPMAQRVFSRAFDIETEGLEDLELSRGTFATALDAKREEFLQSPEFDQSLLLPSTRAALGLEPSEDVAAARDVEAQMRLNSLIQIREDPELMAEHVERELGRDPTNLRIPGTGDQPDRIVPFDTSAAARIYAQFLLQRENFSFRLKTQQMEEGNPLVKEVKDAVELAGISVSSTALQRVFSVYQEAVQTGDPQIAQDYLNNPRVAEGEKLALRFLAGSIEVGEAAFLNSIAPGLGSVYRALSALGEDTDPEDTIELMLSLMKPGGPFENTLGTLDDPGFEAALPGGRSPFGGLQLTLPSRDGAAELGSGAGAAREEGGLDPDVVVTDAMIQQAFDAGDPAIALADRFGEDRVRQVLGEDALAPGRLDPDVAEAAQIPEGGMNPDAVPLPFRADVQQLNRLIRTLERTRGQLARGNLERAIERIRERIRAGVSGG